MTDNAIIRKDGATAGHLQESLATIDDNGSINIPTGETYDINGSPHTHAASGVDNHAIVQGRLTLETGVAISTSDQSAKATLYFTPTGGNLVGTYTDAAWQLQTFTEKSLSLAALTADTNYDIFIEDSDLSLSAVAWTNATTRATALTTQDGVLVLTGDVSKRYLGTIRINSTGGQCEDTVSKRYVWNYYNRAPRLMQVLESTSNWTYTTASWRAANNSTANKVEYVCGVSDVIISAKVQVRAVASGGGAGSAGVGVDTATANSAQLIWDTSDANSNNLTAEYAGYPGLGYHYLQWIEYARAATMNYYGTASIADQKSGMLAFING